MLAKFSEHFWGGSYRILPGVLLSESDIYSATINEDYYAEAGVVSKGSVHHAIERIGSGKMKSKR